MNALGGVILAKEATIQKKQQEVNALKEKMESANSVVLLDYLGLSVAEIDELRTKLIEEGCEMAVIKNNIIRRAAQEAGFEPLADETIGPNAVAFSNEDSVSAAKVIYEFAKEHSSIDLKVGVVDGEYMNHERIQKIATIPTREELLTMFARGILEPVKNVAVALKLHSENLENDNG